MELLAFLLPTLFFSVFFLRKLQIPTVIGYIIVGAILAYFFPYLKDFQEVKELEFFKEFAVALMFFYVGLEFSLNKIIEGIKSYKLALIDFALNFIPLFLISILFFDLKTSLIVALALYPSSTALIINLLVESKRIVNKESIYLINILVLEDLTVILALLFLSPILQGNQINFVAFLLLIVKFVALALLYLLIRNKFLKYLKRLFIESQSDDYFILFLMGFILLLTVLFKKIGLIEYLGPFLLGSLIAEINKSDLVSRYLISFKEFTMAIFFFLFGLNLNISSLKLSDIPIILLLTLVAVVFKIISTYLALRTKLNEKESLRGALSFVPRGEFSVILSSLNKKAQIYNIPVIVLTILIGTFLFKTADKIANKVFKKKVFI